MRTGLATLALFTPLALTGCDKAGGDVEPGTPTEPLFSGPFVYDSVQDDQHLIDTLWIVTEQAVEEIADLGETPEQYLNWRLEAMNDTLERSLVDSSVVRALGVHTLNDHDLDRVGVDIGNTNVNISTALNWLGSYRESYGADKVMIIAGTQEGASGAALGGGDVSAHWVSFLPIEHEFGHQMGGSHCNEGDPEKYNFGYPLSGYDDEGFPIGPGSGDAPDEGGTRMCGNSVAIYSNPDVRLSLEEIDDLVAQGLAPSGDWSELADEDGLVPFGDPIYANMAQQWRDVEASAAARLPTSLYPGEAALPYPVDDCIGLFADEGYGTLIAELCAGETDMDFSEVSSVQVGSGVHANLYSKSNFGADSMCGGRLLRLAYSSPSLDAMSDHHDLSSMDDDVNTVSVYLPDDRETHLRRDGPYAFHGAGTQPSCDGSSVEELVLMPDNRDWTATAAVYKTAVDVPFAVDFQLRSYHDDEDPPADGMTFFFGKGADSYDEVTPPREQLGFVPDGTGYALMINTWTQRVGLRDGTWNPIGGDVGHNSYTDGEWVPVRIEVREDSVVILWNGVELHRSEVALDTVHNSVGFTAGTGYYTAEYRLRGIEYTPL